MDEKGRGCGLLFTAGKEVNDIHDEMSHHKTIRHSANPQVVDAKTQELRSMTLEEKSRHFENIESVMLQHLRDHQKLYPKNKFSIVKKLETDDFVEHEIHVEPEYGEYVVEKQTSEVSRNVLSSAMHVQDSEMFTDICTQINEKITTSHVVRCPECGKEAYRTTFEEFSSRSVTEHEHESLLESDEESSTENNS